jgi:hypothetical protein
VDDTHICQASSYGGQWFFGFEADSNVKIGQVKVAKFVEQNWLAKKYYCLV